MVTDRIFHQDAPKVLDKILQGFSNTKYESRRRKLVESVLRTLHKAKLHTNCVEAIINRIVREFPQYGKTSLTQLVEFCLASIRNNDDEHTR